MLVPVHKVVPELTSQEIFAASGSVACLVGAVLLALVFHRSRNVGVFCLIVVLQVASFILILFAPVCFFLGLAFFPFSLVVFIPHLLIAGIVLAGRHRKEPD